MNLKVKSGKIDYRCLYDVISENYKDGRGLPYTLNDAVIKKINDFIDHYNISSRHIHLEKGDLHQIGFDCRPMKFDYRNFGSFAPPSNWVQHNFGNSRSIFASQVVYKDGRLDHSDIYLNYKKII